MPRLGGEFVGLVFAIRDSGMRDELDQIRTWLLEKRTLGIAAVLLVVALVVSWGAMRMVEGQLALPDGAEAVEVRGRPAGAEDAGDGPLFGAVLAPR